VVLFLWCSLLGLCKAICPSLSPLINAKESYCFAFAILEKQGHLRLCGCLESILQFASDSGNVTLQGDERNQNILSDASDFLPECNVDLMSHRL